MGCRSVKLSWLHSAKSIGFKLGSRPQERGKYAGPQGHRYATHSGASLDPLSHQGIPAVTCYPRQVTSPAQEISPNLSSLTRAWECFPRRIDTAWLSPTWCFSNELFRKETVLIILNILGKYLKKLSRGSLSLLSSHCILLSACY